MPQGPHFLTAIRNQTILQPLLPTLPIATQGYGQPQSQTNEWSSTFIQQEALIQQKLQAVYGPVPVVSTLSVQSYGHVSEGYGVMARVPQLDEKLQSTAQTSKMRSADTILKFFIL
ncbi:unnamed protein product [Rotaria sp. Silwood2]|nr:unnamed protein product [Rotaria sp. Silwood2]CAF4626759.1 unnamed protein product [Rotaria sp. Silwood2]